MKRVDIQSLPCNLKDTEVKLSRFFVAKIRIMCYRPLFIIIRATSETHMRLRCQIDCWLLSYIFWILGALHFLQEATPLSSLWGVCVATAHPVRLPSNTRTLRVWGRVCQCLNIIDDDLGSNAACFAAHFLCKYVNNFVWFDAMVSSLWDWANIGTEELVSFSYIFSCINAII